MWQAKGFWRKILAPVDVTRLLTYQSSMVRFISFLACLLTLSVGAGAQDAQVEPLTLQPAGEAYLRAIRLRGIDTDVAYYDPGRSAPAFETDQDFEPQEDEEEGEEAYEVSLGTSFIAAAVLIAIFYLFFQYGGRFSVSLKGDAQNKARVPGTVRSNGAMEDALPDDLATILRTKDRRDALVMLAQSALLRAIDESGLLLQRSWTARDALRHLPADLTHRKALSELVTAGELVHFGGRDVSEELFEHYVARIKPMFAGAAS